MSHRNTPFPVIMSSVSLGTIISAVGPKPIKEVPLGPLLYNSFLKNPNESRGQGFMYNACISILSVESKIMILS